jgi:hypothetical protein
VNGRLKVCGFKDDKMKRFVKEASLKIMKNKKLMMMGLSEICKTMKFCNKVFVERSDFAYLNLETTVTF